MRIEALPAIDPARLPEAVEALLFASPDPVSLERLAYALGVEEHSAYEAVTELRTRYGHERRGLTIVKVADGYQMCTHPDFAPHVSRLLEAAPARLSRAALETLSIIAYRQPITLPEIEAIRGVDSAGVVRTLLDRGLIEEAGRKDTVGRPVLYVTTKEFLVYFGLNDLSELPGLDQLPQIPDGLSSG
ncbi:MAG: SMC-Scp complex subunit ScpB [Armatimonadota bacterium]